MTLASDCLSVKVKFSGSFVSNLFCRYSPLKSKIIKFQIHVDLCLVFFPLPANTDAAILKK